MTDPVQTAQGSGINAPVRLEWLDRTFCAAAEDSPVVKAVDERFHIELKPWSVSGGGFWDSANDSFESGELPDVLVLDSVNQLPDYVAMGIIAALPVDEIREKAPHYAQAVDVQNDPAIWSSMRYLGKNYGIANLVDAAPTVMVWRKDWLDRLGLPIPVTLDDYEKVLTAFVKEDPDGDGENDTSAMAERAFGAIFGAYGLRCWTKTGSEFLIGQMQPENDGTPFFPYIRPEAKDALSTLHKWYGRGIIDREFVTGENHGGYEWLSHSFMYGKIGLTCAPPGEYLIKGTDTKEEKNWGECMKELKRIDSEADIVFGPPPIGPGGKSGTVCEGKTGRLTCLTLKGASDPRKVAAFFAMLDANYADMGTKLEHEATKPGYYPFEGLPVKALSDSRAALTELTDQAYFDMITGVKPLGYFSTYVSEFEKQGKAAAERAVRQAYGE